MKGDINKTIQLFLDNASDIASKEVEKLARKILKEHPRYDEFIMGMGSYTFTLKNGEGHVDTMTSRMNSRWVYIISDTYEYFKPLNDFMGEWDEILKISGEPMRFTATSEIT